MQVDRRNPSPAPAAAPAAGSRLRSTCPVRHSRPCLPTTVEGAVLSEADSKELLRMQAAGPEVLEDLITRIYVDLLERGDTCLDGGASRGLHTIRLARIVGPEGVVFSVELEPSSARELQALLREKSMDNV